jgi:hypothetical protein
MHRNDRFSSIFTWIVPMRLLVSKSRIEPNRIDGGIGDNPPTARRQNELFDGYDHFAAYSAPLETRLYRD